MTHAVVMKLVQPIRDQGHHVFMDNYYTSPQLFSDLRANGFGACGTLRLNLRGLPAAIKQRVRKGDIKAIRLDPSMLAIKWMDKRLVTVLTTIHDNGVVEIERRSRHAVGGTERIKKPRAVAEYNRYMGGVDTADQLLSYYGFSHRTVKLWRRTLFYLLDMAVVNSYIVYAEKNPDKRRRLTHEQYIVQLATDLLSVAGNTPRTALGRHRQSSQPAARLTEQHFLATLGHNQAGRPIQEDCSVCSKRKGRERKTSTCMCRECNLPMCVVPCFELHHTRKDPQRYL